MLLLSRNANLLVKNVHACVELVLLRESIRWVLSTTRACQAVLELPFLWLTSLFGFMHEAVHSLPVIPHYFFCSYFNFTLQLRNFISSTKCQSAVKEAVARIHLSLLMVGTVVLYVRWFTMRIASSFRISAPSAKLRLTQKSWLGDSLPSSPSISSIPRRSSRAGSWDYK